MKHVLLLHGAIGSAAQLMALKNGLNSSFTVHLADFPGHGGTPMPEQFSIPFFADHVKEYCAINKLQTVSIFGYSMGGYIGMYLAKQYPELVEKVVTLATKFYWDEPTAAKERKMLQPEILEQKVPEFAATLQHRHAPNDWKQLLQMTSDMLGGLGQNNVLRLEDYAAIHTPSLLMLGDRDKMVSIEETVRVYQHLPQAQLAVLPATPHPIEQVNTELLSSMIKRFFD